MRRMIAILVAAIVFATAGCIDYSEKLVLNKDGSGSMRMRFAMDKEARRQAEQMAKDMAAAFGGGEEAMEEMVDPFDVLDEGQINARLKRRNSKAKLKTFKRFDDGGDEVTEMEITFTGKGDFPDIAYALDPDEEPSDDDIPFTFEKNSDGLWLFQRDFDAGTDASMSDMGDFGGAGGGGAAPGAGGTPGGLGDMFGGKDPTKMSEEELQDMMKNLQENMGKLQGDAEQMQADMEKSFEGRTMRFEVQFPGKVVESNATSVKGNVAIWEYPLNEMQEGNVPDIFTAKVKN